MQVYEYAVIRYVPKVEREEFINIGLLIFCKSKRSLHSSFCLNKDRIACFSSELDFETLKAHVAAFEEVAKGVKTSKNPIAQLDAAERFRWLTAVKSSCIQASRPHPGMTSDLEVLFKRLFEELVL
ncbi:MULTISPECIES: DUF3037 domain-containing protein [Myroides]|uniref:DUF3037 domain-containing protein n=1 Tax=Myroides albus TaxID=2562892 RepID=A0A6I3LGA1_9FLAO|nr:MULTISPECIES: DUF3037 domain-containing protein [Myroides]MTG98519.1 DUF3037 domain-containing protein [Myroides albus]MVX34938.1 DUF3037 domain-containing protein [Myroides sp. LoEW2-1]